MTVSALSAARTLCELRDWQVSNLELQKVLYLAHMFYLGETNGEPLIDDTFQAWDFGPVAPAVYHHVKGFGSDPVRNVFHYIPSVDRQTHEYRTLEGVVEATEGMRPGKLIAITHWDKGAWAKHYVAGFRGIRIPDEDILMEYRERVAT